MEEDAADTQQGGSNASVVRLLLKGRDTGGTALWGRNLGGHPPHGHGPGEVSEPGGKTADGTASIEDNRRDVEIHLGGIDKGGGGFLDDGGIRQASP